MKDSITRPDVTGQSSTTLPAYSRTVARKLIQDLDTEVRAGTEKSPRFMAVYGKLLNQHLSSDRPSELYVHIREETALRSLLMSLSLGVANSGFQQAWISPRSQLNVMADQDSPAD